jgi:S-adenosylmethionine:tRNA ribosyltransferase-isomerase
VSDSEGPRSTAAYRYELPEVLIAKYPAEPADAARLLVLRANGQIEHRTFVELSSLLARGDVLVINETRVIRARLHGRREPGGGASEVLLLKPLDHSRFDATARHWRALVRPGRRLRIGARITFGEEGACEIVAVASDGVREVLFDAGVALPELLERHGELPLPPYVGRGDEARAARYQTLFARAPGSVAAPTASLHFTPRVLEALQERGVEIVKLELDVGYGTFKPIASERIDDHVMHAERFAIPAATASAIERAKREGRRIVAAGTTALRALESAVDANGGLLAGDGESALFVTPGFRFRIVDVLLTNFHLPGSSLLVLAAAFAGYDRIIGAYRAAIESSYRFFSFGDAMLIEREIGH